MARPQEYNREDVIEKALIVFRRKGYNGTSMRDLEAITGLNPGSFYSAFGNKHSFFIETLRYFYTYVQNTFQGVTSVHENPIDGLRAFSDCVIDSIVDETEKARCCYVIKSALELAAVDEKVHDVVCEHFSVLEEKFASSIQRAIEGCFIDDSIDVTLTAKLILNNLFGFNVNGMLAPNRESLVAMRDTLFNLLLPTKH